MREILKTAKQRLTFLLVVAMVMTSFNLTAFAAEDVTTEAIETSAADEAAVTEVVEETQSEDTEEVQEPAVVEESASVEESVPATTDEIVEALTGADVTSPLEVPDGNTTYMKAVMNSKGQIKVSWKKMNKSKYYKLYRFVSDYNGQGVEGFEPIIDAKLKLDGDGFTKKTSFVDYDALGDSVTSFVYKVVAFDKDKQLVEANTEKNIPNAVTAVCMPVVLNIESTSVTTDYDGVDNGESAIDFSFEQVKGPHITYEIFRDLNSKGIVSEEDCNVFMYEGKAVKSDKAIGVTYRDNSGDISVGTKYNYQVRAVFTVGDKKIVSGTTKKKSIRATIAKPYLMWVYNVSSNKVQVVFNRIKGASHYEIFYSTKENGSYKKMSTKMTGGKITEQFAKNHPFEYPYYIEGEEIWKNDGWAAIDVEMKPETTYFYRVRAVSAADKKPGPMSDWDYEMTHLDLVTDLFATNTSDAKTGIELSFSKIGGATQYRVRRKNLTNGTDFEDVAISKGKVRIHNQTQMVYITDRKQLTPSNNYVYQVIPRVGKVECEHTEQELISSNEVICTQAGPRAEAGSYSLRFVKAKWKAISKADSYEIQYSSTYDPSNPENPLGAGAKSFYVYKGEEKFSKRYQYVPVNPGKWVYIRVKADVKNGGEFGETGWSEVVCAQGRPKALTGLSASWDSDNGDRTILKWDRSSEYPEVSNYRVEYCTGNGNTNYAHATDTTAQKMRKVIDDGVTYNFRVAGIYKSDESGVVVGKWTTCKFSTPRYLELDDEKANAGRSHDWTKGSTNTIGVKYLNEDKKSFTPTEKKVNWYTNTSWISVSTNDNYGGVIKINPNCPAGTYSVTARTFNYKNHRSNLTKTFYINVK